MIRFNSYDYGGLFGTGSGSIFGSSFYSNLSQLSSIRSGAYSKALKAYYAKNKEDQVSARNTVADRNRFTDTFTAGSDLARVSRESSELVASAGKLSDPGKESLFYSREKYDPEEALKAVKEFAGSYNEALDSLKGTSDRTVRNAGESMTRMTGIMTGSLANIGIGVGADGRLSVNEEDFKNADFARVKTLLGSGGSYARIIGSSAQRLHSASEQQSRYLSNGTGLYGRYGSSRGYYGYSGINFNAWF